MSRPRKSTISLAEIAEIAGVSISTASKVANGNDNVADATRERVARVLAEHRYETPSQRNRQWTAIGILIRGMKMPNVHGIELGAIDAAREYELAAQVIHLDPEAERAAENAGWLDSLPKSGVKGIIAINSVLTAAVTDRLERIGVSLVTVNPTDRPSDGYSVGSTDWAGGLAITEHLLELGHQRIVMLAGDARTLCSRARVAGYSSAMASAELPENIVSGNFTYNSGMEVATQVLRRPQPPTAIVAASDFQALGAIETARQLGLRVPEDVSITGFDDTLLASMSSPRLTTVKQPFEAMGRVALEVVADLMVGNRPGSHHVELATSLIIRDSATLPSGKVAKL